jgi:hypothetical protein
VTDSCANILDKNISIDEARNKEGELEAHHASITTVSLLGIGGKKPNKKKSVGEEVKRREEKADTITPANDTIKNMDICNEAQVGSSGTGNKKLEKNIKKYLDHTGTTDIDAALAHLGASNNDVNYAIIKHLEIDEVKADVTKQNLDRSNNDGSVANSNEVTHFSTPTDNKYENK